MLEAGDHIPLDATVWIRPRETVRIGELVAAHIIGGHLKYADVAPFDRNRFAEGRELRHEGVVPARRRVELEPDPRIEGDAPPERLGDASSRSAIAFCAGLSS